MSNGPSQKKIGVAIVGLGNAGRIHLRNLVTSWRVRLLWMVDADQDLAKKLHDEYNLDGVTLTKPQDIGAVYRDARVQAIFVCTPTPTHEEYVVGALEAGKAVFCEKPIANDVQTVQRCYDCAAKVDKLLFCSFQRRFDPAINDVSTRVQNGEIGNVYTINSCSRDNPVPQVVPTDTSGGYFHNSAIHDIDLLNWILNEFPYEVYVAAHAHREDVRANGDVDTVIAILKFPSNTMATLELSRMGYYGYHQTVQAFGSKGMIVADNQRPTNVHYSGKEGTTVVPIEYSYPQRYAKAYQAAVECFLDIVQGKRDIKAAVSRESAVSAAVVADACNESLRTGHPVKIRYPVTSP